MPKDEWILRILRQRKLTHIKESKENNIFINFIGGIPVGISLTFHTSVISGCLWLEHGQKPNRMENEEYIME